MNNKLYVLSSIDFLYDRFQTFVASWGSKQDLNVGNTVNARNNDTLDLRRRLCHWCGRYSLPSFISYYSLKEKSNPAKVGPISLVQSDSFVFNRTRFAFMPGQQGIVQYQYARYFPHKIPIYLKIIKSLIPNFCWTHFRHFISYIRISKCLQKLVFKSASPWESTSDFGLKNLFPLYPRILKPLLK